MVEDVIAVDDSIYMTNEWTNGAHWFPNEPGVQEHQEARGWVVAKPPEDKPFVPNGLSVPVTTEFIEMYHPGVHARHQYPANTEAIAGAMEAGWVLLKGDDLDPVTSSPAGEKVTEEKEETTKRSAKAKATKTDEKDVNSNG
jgi:hypothetical protein